MLEVDQLTVNRHIQAQDELRSDHMAREAHATTPRIGTTIPLDGSSPTAPGLVSLARNLS